MKNFLFLCAFLIVTLMTSQVKSQVPFKKGVNLTSWFQATNAKQIPFTKFSKSDLVNIKSLGCDVIRLPINMHAMTSGGPDYVLDPLLFQFLDQAVDWAEELGIHIILDNHSFDPNADTQPSVEAILVKVWSQLAEHYNQRSTHVYYEVLNEPHGISATAWGNIQQSVINAIRAKDTKHTIIVGGVGYNSYDQLKNIPFYTDTNLIYTFHFYDPFLFTHQGASWVEPSMVPLAGVPFPYQAAKMPAVPPALKGSWVEDLMKNYPTQGNANYVKQLIDIAVKFAKDRSVPVYCGEFGVFMDNSDNDQRVAWYTVARSYLEEQKIPWTMWDYVGGFGIFKKGSNDLFEYDVNVPLIQSLGLVAPEQLPIPDQLQKSGMIIYDDFIAKGIESFSSTSENIDFYNSESTHAGEHSILWTNAAQYSNIAFDFKPNINLSLLASSNFTLDLWVKGSNATSSFDIRFVDTKKDNTDHPWRFGKTINRDMVQWNGQWQRISIPLKDLDDKGAWDGMWYAPEGKFNWTEVDKLEIVAESIALDDIAINFDDLVIAGEAIVTGTETVMELPEFKIYPNPAHDNITVEYAIKGRFSLDICSPLGQQLRTYEVSSTTSGKQYVTLDVSNIPNGVYLLRLITPSSVSSKKFARN